MSAIDAALRMVKSSISPSLLQLAFGARRYDPIRLDRQYDRSTPVNQEQVIRNTVVYGRVLPDLDLMSGTEVELPLREAEVEKVDSYNTIYRFNNTSLNGRVITQALEVSYGVMNNTVLGVPANVVSYSHHSSQLLKSARDLISIPAPTSTTMVDIIAHNTIQVSDTAPLSIHGTFRAIVSNAPELRNWSRSFHLQIAELITAATKAYVYNQLNTETDIAQIYAGVALSKITQEIESYADQNQIYLDLLKKFTKLGYLNDHTTRRKVEWIAIGNRPKY